MLFLGMDYETTWTTPVDPKIARPLEIGAALYDERGIPLFMYSDLIFEEDHPESPQDLVDLLGGITDEDRKDWGGPSDGVHAKFNVMMEKADFVVAHNGLDFDKVIYEQECYRLGIEVIEKPWIDTKLDLPYPTYMKTRKLSPDLCDAHDFSNPFKHRALCDTMAMMKIFFKYPIEDILELQKETNCKVVASVSFQNKDKAKNRGYYWNPEDKIWWKAMKESQASLEESDAPFPVQIITL